MFSDKVVAALSFATERHGSQMYGQRRYWTHLTDVQQQVQSALRTYETPLREQQEELLVAAILHDILEDTGTQGEEIINRFGSDVFDIVWLVSGVSGDHVGGSRRIRNLIVYDKFAQENGMQATNDPRRLDPWKADAARLVKLCDRSANVSECWRMQDRRLFMYRKEHLQFCAGIQVHKGDPAISGMASALETALGFSP